MGLFSHLFGSSGSDKADRMRQQALDAFGAVQTPELKDLQVQLDKYVQQGVLSPEQAEAELLNSNAFDAIRTDPSLGAAQHQALQALQDTASAGGLTAIDKARLQDVTDQQNTTARGRLDAIKSNARERGVGGSGLEMASALENEQEAANRASRAGTDTAAQAQSAALQALIASGNLAGGMEAQQYGEQAQRAGAQNAIDKFNAETLNSTNLYNTQTANEAQAANLAEKQKVADSNTNVSNQNQLINANASQTLFKDQEEKAAGEAGIYSDWAKSAQDSRNKELGADASLFGGIVNAGATAGAGALAGPVGAAAAPSVVPNTATGFDDPYAPTVNGTKETAYYSGGGEVKAPCMDDGGKVPGKAKAEGDSPTNDTVDAKLSPGELVVPRSAMSDEQEFEEFMNQFKPKKKAKPLKPEEAALADLHKRVTRLEGGK